LVIGLIGSIHAFGPPAFPIWPTLLNFQSAFCHGAISAARAAASPDFALRQRARMGSSRKDGSADVRTFDRASRYFALNPRSRAITSRLLEPSRRSIVAARYLSNGRRPPSLVSKTIP